MRNSSVAGGPGQQVRRVADHALQVFPFRAEAVKRRPSAGVVQRAQARDRGGRNLEAREHAAELRLLRRLDTGILMGGEALHVRQGAREGVGVLRREGRRRAGAEPGGAGREPRGHSLADLRALGRLRCAAQVADAGGEGGEEVAGRAPLLAAA
jgi:hypothetical protein